MQFYWYFCFKVYFCHILTRWSRTAIASPTTSCPLASRKETPSHCSWRAGKKQENIKILNILYNFASNTFFINVTIGSQIKLQNLQFLTVFRHIMCIKGEKLQNFDCTKKIYCSFNIAHKHWRVIKIIWRRVVYTIILFYVHLYAFCKLTPPFKVNFLEWSMTSLCRHLLYSILQINNEGR